MKKLSTPIAIVSLNGLFAEAKNMQQFWSNIVSGRDLITDVPESHWLTTDYYSAEGGEGKVCSKKGSFIPSVPFDPLEFNTPPNTIASTDTAQLLSLIVAKKLLASVQSLVKGSISKKRISTIIGVAGGTELMVSMSSKIQHPVLRKVLREEGLPESVVQHICQQFSSEYSPWVETTFPGLLCNVIAGRIANRLDLGGTNCTVDAACGSSLAALKMGIDELALGHSDLAICGGADAANDIFMYMCFGQTGALSTSDSCNPFSDNADGTLMGEGIGMVALRRLEDAERDKDEIYAVIRAVGSSSDGAGSSVYAPIPAGQARSIRAALTSAGFSIDEISLIEAHGTGTIAGDAAELEGLMEVFSSSTVQGPYCALGSIKSQIGHTKSAAGLAGLLKVALALHHKVLPPTIKVKYPNRAFDLEKTPFYLNTEARPWILPSGQSRKAGVSSFGFGGSNYHVIVEEYTSSALKPKRFANLNQGALFIFHGESKESLCAAIAAVENKLEKSFFTYLAKQTQITFLHNASLRAGFFATDEIDAKQKCQDLLAKINGEKTKKLESNELYFSLDTEKKKAKIAFLFPGQGSQYVGMGADLAMEFDCVAKIWEQVAGYGFDGRSLASVTYPNPSFSSDTVQRNSECLMQTQWAQPAIGTVSLSYLALLNLVGVKADVITGHSYGEIPALYAAGCFNDLSDVIKISRRRGELMADCAASCPGAMVAAYCDVDTLNELLAKEKCSAHVANINSLKQVILSGAIADIEHAEQILLSKDIKFSRLPVSTGFHSPVVKQAVSPFYSYLEKIKFSAQDKKIALYSSSTAKPYPKTHSKICERLAQQIIEPVLFKDTLEACVESGADIFIEVGPSDVLTRLVRENLPDVDAIALDKKGLNGLRSFWQALGRLAVLGVPVQFSTLWQQFAEVEDVLDHSMYSKAMIMINGANYKKPYPPKGGSAVLPSPNPEWAEHHPTKEGSAVLPTSNPERAEHSKLTENKETTDMTQYDQQWLQAFSYLQQSMITSQKLFMESLLQGHTDFLRVLNISMNQLSGGDQNNMQQMANLSKPVSLDVDTSSITLSSPLTVSQLSPLNKPTLQTETNLASTPSFSHLLQPQAHTSNNLTTTQAVVMPSYKDSVMQPPSDAVKPTSQNVDFKEIMLQVVAEKTGYPVEMLDINMDLQSELGIDSIKRVEILSELQNKAPVLARVDRNKLSTMNTLAEILSYAKDEGNGSLGNEFQQKEVAKPEKKSIAAG